VSLPTNAPKLQAFEAGDGARIAAAYDSLAATYDAALVPAQWVRERLWERFDVLFAPGAAILDVTAGTGIDALHLAARGIRVVACDISEGMLAQLRAKDPNIQTRAADFNTLDLAGEFDGVISTFAGLNTARDLRPFAKHAARLLRPGGILFIHLLNRWPLLDIARQFANLKWPSGWRAIASDGRDVDLGGTLIPHYLHSPLPLYRKVFALNFRPNRLSGQGILRPVGARQGGTLENMEKSLASIFPFHSLGTFFSIEMTRR